MTETAKVLPKRRFALEEKDLAVEADENNKKAEKKEKHRVKKCLLLLIKKVEQ